MVITVYAVEIVCYPQYEARRDDVHGADVIFLTRDFPSERWGKRNWGAETISVWQMYSSSLEMFQVS